MSKLFFVLIITIVSVISAGAQNKVEYDSVLAKSLGADANGMRRYVLVILKPGANKITDTVKRKELLSGHMKNINRLAEEGKLAIAGPFMKGPYSGIYIFSVSNVEEAKILTDTDPAIKEGMFDVELHPWYGSAALMMVPGNHDRLIKKKN